MKGLKRVVVLILAFVCFLFVFAGCAEKEEKPEHLGLYNDGNGTMMLDGKPFYGLGVNYYNLFNGAFQNKWDNSAALEALETLKSYDVRVIRFNCGIFYMHELDYYFLKKDRYFEVLDEVVAKAEELGIGLIPSFFWGNSICDYYDEPLATALRDPTSKSLQFVRDYTTEIVTRYVDSPALYMWEYGNERNLLWDLPFDPNTAQPLPAGSSRDTRTEEEDRVRSSDMMEAYKVFAATIKGLDPYNRLISDGAAAHRAQAWHLAYDKNGEGSWETDTVEQHYEMFDMPVKEGGLTALSTHAYSNGVSATETDGDFGSDFLGLYSNWNEFCAYLIEGSKRNKVPVYIGEMGYGYNDVTVSDIENGFDAEKKVKVFRDIAEAIYEEGVQLGLFWTYDALSTFAEGDIIDRSTGVEYSWNENSEKGLGILNIVKEFNQKMDEKYQSNTAEAK